MESRGAGVSQSIEPLRREMAPNAELEMVRFKGWTCQVTESPLTAVK